MNQTLSFVILSNGRESQKELRTALSEDSRTQLLAVGDDPKQLYQEIVRLRPTAAIITLDSDIEACLSLVQRVSTECPQMVIICASAASFPDLILRSLRAGAREFLRLPIIREELRTVLDRTTSFCSSLPESPKKKARTISVFSSKGGCGTSFIAANLAAALEAPTVLMDLNLYSGDLDLSLGTEPNCSIADMVENISRLDDSLLSSYLVPHSPMVALLASPQEADQADVIEPEHVFQVIQVLRDRFDYIVIDPQHTFDAITLAALDQSDEIVLVMSLDVPSVRSAQRTLKIFDKLGYPRRKTRIVVNRWSKDAELDLQQVERVLGEKVMGYVQSDYSLVISSINLGQPVIESSPASKVATQIRQIAGLITGKVEKPQQAEPSKGILSGLLNRNGKTPNLNIFKSNETAVINRKL
jgi:pilus assembly protein CpaE